VEVEEGLVSEPPPSMRKESILENQSLSSWQATILKSLVSTYGVIVGDGADRFLLSE
jgi:hypothetical protein